MEVLPDGTTNGARDAGVVFEPREAALDGLGDQVPHDRTALGAEGAVDAELEGARHVPDDESTESTVADEDVRAEPQDEAGNSCRMRGSHRPRQIVGAVGGIQQVSRAANPERGERCEQSVAFQPPGIEPQS